MATTTDGGKPPLTISRSGHESLSRLAEFRAARDPVMSEQLFAELDRALAVEDRRAPADVVLMGATLRSTAEASEDQTVTLVFPGAADIAKGSVSILTPIGAALIGLSATQSIDWTSRDGRIHTLTVERVEPADVAKSPQSLLRTA